MLNFNCRLLGYLLAMISLLYAGWVGCQAAVNPILLFPAIVAIDSGLERVFIIDNQDNGIYLVDPVDNLVVGGEALLSDEDPQLLPDFPSNAALASLGNGISRLFVIGTNNVSPQNQITVLDFDDGGGLRASSISPIAVSGLPTDVLVGVAVDSVDSLVLVSNSDAGTIHAFDLNTGTEAANSPVTVTGLPERIQFDPGSGLLAVSNAASNLVSLIDPTNLAAVPASIDVGVLSRDVALVTNASGTVLFVSGNQQNTARVFKVDVANPAASTLLFEVNPAPPTGPPPDPNFLTGNLNQVRAGVIANGQVGGFFTQSSGDLLVLDLSSDLYTVTPSIVTVGAASAEGLDLLLDGANQVIEVWYASPGIGTVTIVDALNNEFADQVE